MFRIRLLAGWVLLLAAPFTVPAETVLIQLQVIEGEGAIHTAGTKASRPITVQVTDETGKPVAGAGVTFRLPEENASGFFDTGLRSDVQITGHDGRASVWSILWGNVPGPVKIRVTASKDVARAGTIVSQYLNEPSAAASPASTSPAPASPASAEPAQTRTITAGIRPATPAVDPAPKPVIAVKRRTNTRWLLIGAAAGGAVAVALLAGKSGAATAGQSSGGSTTPPIPSISIGSPTISVGKP